MEALANYNNIRGEWGRGMTFYDHDRFLFLNAPVGIGTNSPSANLHVAGDNGVLFEGTLSNGTIPKQGPGMRMIWYPKKGAFRAGSVEAAQWDDANIGFYSTAMGYNAKASGARSMAIGMGTTASGESAIALGVNTTANGDHSTAMGNTTTASGYASTATGSYTTASGQRTIATGMSTIASGDNSTAMGSYVSTNGHSGSFIIGDYSATNVPMINNDNQFMAVFAGGYRVYTDRTWTHGVYMDGGTSGWTNISDRNKKENFRPLDGEQVLQKIRGMSISEWNYKGTDPRVRYIGPVAQDFYTAFRLGGTDSLGINSICIDGVNMAAVQALEQRTRELREKTAELERVNARLAALEGRLARVEAALQAATSSAGGVAEITQATRTGR